MTRRLIDGGDGDAALLYLCLLKNRGSASPETLRAELKWDGRAARAPRPPLPCMGLVSAPEAGGAPLLARPAPTAERPAYSREDVARKLRAGRELFPRFCARSSASSARSPHRPSASSSGFMGPRPAR